ncbi:MAG: hypothetical protein MUE97_02440, partial [Phycisphaerales bacterium]|nr:hypothetical protein [Phycisphaerales bacterium]
MACICALMLCIFAGGCQFQQHRGLMNQFAAEGRFESALSTLDDPRVRQLYDETDQLLLELDRGALLLYLGRYDEAISELERAEARMDRQREASAADTIAQWLLNDAAATYVGEPYEDVYTNVMKILAQLRQGRVDGGASVEARRIIGKTSWLRDRFRSASDEAKRETTERRGKADLPAAPSQAIGLRDATTAGQFIDSPLGTYLAAVTFMQLGEQDAQALAARRLTEAITKQPELIGPVRAEAFASLGQVRREDVNVLLVGLTGRGPVKVPQRFGPLPLGDVPVYFELPVLQTSRSRADRVRVTLTPTGAGSASGAQQVTLSFVENLGKVAEENHARQMPLIYARTFIRAAAKSVASYAVTQGIRRGQERPGSPRSRSNDEALLSTIIALAAIATTERADVRAWAFLP